MWIWFAIGSTAFFSASLVAGVVVTAALRDIARRTSKLLDEEVWTTVAPTRATTVFPNVGAVRLTPVPKHFRASE